MHLKLILQIQCRELLILQDLTRPFFRNCFSGFEATDDGNPRIMKRTRSRAGTFRARSAIVNFLRPDSLMYGH